MPLTECELERLSDLYSPEVGVFRVRCGYLDMGGSDDFDTALTRGLLIEGQTDEGVVVYHIEDGPPTEWAY